MEVEYDDLKRAKTLDKRGLDFRDTPQVFEGFYLTRPDDRKDYGEVRYITLGALNGKTIVIVWTERNEAVRVISMRPAHEDERDIYRRELERSG